MKKKYYLPYDYALATRGATPGLEDPELLWEDIYNNRETLSKGERALLETIKKEVDKRMGKVGVNNDNITSSKTVSQEVNITNATNTTNTTKEVGTKSDIDNLIKYHTERQEYWTLFKKNLNKLGYNVIQGKGTIDDSWTEYMDLYISKKDNDPILRKVKEQTDKEFGKSIDEIEGTGSITNAEGGNIEVRWDDPRFH